MVVAGGLTPIWHQDILNRHGEIGQLFIVMHFFFRKIVPWCQILCRTGKITQCNRLHFCFFCDCMGVLFVMTVMQSIPVWCYFCERHRMSPVQVVTLYQCKPSCCFIEGTFVFWICIAITSVGTGSANVLVPSGPNKPLPHYLNQCWRRFATPYCVARPQ